MANKELFIKVKGKALCSKCRNKLNRGYHSWCAECYNEYKRKKMALDKELGRGDYIYFIANLDTGIICYTGKSNSIVIRYKGHLEWLTSNFGKMIRSTNGEPSRYRMYVMDLTELGVTKAEHIAIEHQHNYSHKDTVFNTDIRVTDKDINILSELDERGMLDKIDMLEWIEYNRFIKKKMLSNSTLMAS